MFNRMPSFGSSVRMLLNMPRIPSWRLGWAFFAGVWSIYLHPRYIGPLRKIPAAQVDWRTSLYRWLWTEPSPIQLLQWAKSIPNDGIIRYTSIGGTPTILLLSSEAIKEVLVTKHYSTFEKPLLARQRLGALSGYGLPASGGEAHKMQKRKLLPAFNFRIIKDLYPVYWTKAGELSSLLASRFHQEVAAGGKTLNIDVLEWSTKVTLDIIGIAAWGRDFNALRNPHDPFIQDYERPFKPNKGGIFMKNVALRLPISVILKLPTKTGRDLRTAMTAARIRCRQAIEEKKKLKPEELEKSKDILSVAMKSGAFDDMALVDQTMSILSAGHDTSSLSLTWGTFALCKHPDVQAKLRHEIRSMLPSPSAENEDAVDPALLESLPYLKAVTNEILRLYTPVPSVRREALQDTTICGHSVPAGTSVMFSPWVTNKLELHWGKNAEDFVPERWMEGDLANTGGAADAFAFSTFSQGPRNCIGQGFARAEFMALLAALVGRFEIQLEDPGYEPEPLFAITVRPAEGMRVKLRTDGLW
ncbi:cytochrome P450 [Saccharata proteae CBS 121410]|uniref:Cytochrome P450 n=1 Tax=Saccharata proteae CBS 121410 TaxID=1314787 RepID=A0A9P4HVW7_9PEZI|nr:cytochrome P450 [Saccharata proteae CBS 121410]